MKEIKFRLRDKDNGIIGYEGWNKELSRWQYTFVVGETMDTTCPICHSPTGEQSLKFLNKIKYKDQYTGLKDKNGKEIYEGDTIAQQKGKVKRVIAWEEHVGFDMPINIPSVGNPWEVIGNIYENPELLGEPK